MPVKKSKSVAIFQFLLFIPIGILCFYIGKQHGIAAGILSFLMSGYIVDIRYEILTK